MGEITLPIRIGLVTFEITFQVMDIRPAYNYLLGKPWIHATEVVPSSLHQKVKFITELMISTPTPTKYIEEDEEALETSFQSFEIIGTTGATMEQEDSKRSRAAIMVARVLIKGGYQSGTGLGNRLESIAEPVTIQENLGRAELDYQGRNAEGGPDWRTQKIQKQGQPKIKPDLHQHFVSGGIILPKQVAMIGNRPSNQQE
ncbi:hypothetical protein CR513_51125, partial [Mucuna pruriens]